MALGVANGFAVMSFTILAEKASEADVDTRYIYLSSASVIEDVTSAPGWIRFPLPSAQPKKR